MIQKIIKVGTSAAVVLPKALIAQSGMSIGDSIRLDYNKETGAVVFVPVPSSHETHRDKVARLTLGFIERYRDDLEKLATE